MYEKLDLRLQQLLWLAESLADEATEAVPTVKSPSPSAAVVTTELALTDPVSVPSVELFVPFPRGNLSLKSGKSNVEEPSPVPYAVPIAANREAYVDLLTAVPSQINNLWAQKMRQSSQLCLLEQVEQV